jgi:hypothetical protein
MNEAIAALLEALEDEALVLEAEAAEIEALAVVQARYNNHKPLNEARFVVAAAKRKAAKGKRALPAKMRGDGE